jgi:hypothetical protein
MPSCDVIGKGIDERGGGREQRMEVKEERGRPTCGLHI